MDSEAQDVLYIIYGYENCQTLYVQKLIFHNEDRVHKFDKTQDPVLY